MNRKTPIFKQRFVSLERHTLDAQQTRWLVLRSRRLYHLAQACSFLLFFFRLLFCLNTAHPHGLQDTNLFSSAMGPPESSGAHSKGTVVQDAESAHGGTLYQDYQLMLTEPTQVRKASLRTLV